MIPFPFSEFGRKKSKTGDDEDDESDDELDDDLSDEEIDFEDEELAKEFRGILLLAFLFFYS